MILWKSQNRSVHGDPNSTLGEPEYEMLNWRWEDNTETSIILSVEYSSETVERTISSLTSTNVVFSPLFYGDIIQMKAK